MIGASIALLGRAAETAQFVAEGAAQVGRSRPGAGVGHAAGSPRAPENRRAARSRNRSRISACSPPISPASRTDVGPAGRVGPWRCSTTSSPPSTTPPGTGWNASRRWATAIWRCQQRTARRRTICARSPISRWRSVDRHGCGGALGWALGLRVGIHLRSGDRRGDRPPPATVRLLGRDHQHRQSPGGPGQDQRHHRLATGPCAAAPRPIPSPRRLGDAERRRRHRHPQADRPRRPNATPSPRREPATQA